jgi:hypothetical protein
MQNVINYSAEKGDAGEDDQDLSFGILIIGKREGQFYIQCGNYVTQEQEAPLRHKLTKIQSMDKDELKKFYKEQRRKEASEGSKGAGLGFIEMARKASEPITFDFAPAKAEKLFFVITAVV